MPIDQHQLPGPKGLPLVGNLHQVKLSGLHAWFEKQAREHGEVFKVKLGPEKLTVISRPEMIHHILKSRPQHFRRLSKLDRVLQEEGIHGLFNAEGEAWKLHRRIVTRGLDLKHQQRFFPVMKTIVERLYRKLEVASDTKQLYQVREDMTRFTVDVTTTLAFGIDMNTLEQQGSVIQDHMEKIFPMIFRRINSPFAMYKLYRSKADREYAIALSVIEKEVQRFIEAGRARLHANPALHENPSNILEALLVAAAEEEGITDKAIRSNLLTLLMAGEDTTAHAITWAAYLLALHPDVQARLQEEADAVLGDHVCLQDYAAHDKLTYTNAVIQEVLRLKSVAPVMLVEPIEDFEVDGYRLSRGSKVVLLTRAGALREEHFSNSTRFDPDRWLVRDHSKCPVHNAEAHVPFGVGPRLCPGKNLAILEMKLVLSMLAKNFVWKLANDQQEVKERMAFTMMPTEFFMVMSKR